MALALATGCSHAERAGGKRSLTHWTPEFKIQRFVLDNGLTALFIEDHAVPIVSYTTWFKVGSAWEKRGSTGIAHLFEHLMFKGTPRFSAKKFNETLERKGAEVNAYTQQDVTVYYETIASKYLELVIDMEADRLANLRLTQADLDSEREVVKEERRLRLESSFIAQQMEALDELAFPEHPYGWPIVGYQDDLSRLTLQECQDFFKAYYQPGNALVTIAGDFDTEQAKAWIRKYYGPIRGHDVPKLELPPVKPRGVELEKTVTKPVKSESLLMGYYVPTMYSDDAEKLSMLAWTLFGLASSRANLKLVREKQMALEVGAEASLKRFPYLFLVWAEMKSGFPSSAAREEIDALIEEIKQVPPSEVELERVKNAILVAMINEGKSPAGVASWLANGEFYWNDYWNIRQSLRDFEAVTPADVQAMARKYLRKENRVVVYLKPEEKAYAIGPYGMGAGSKGFTKP